MGIFYTKSRIPFRSSLLLLNALPFLTLIEIGYELCGSYTLLPDKSTFVQCEPATNHNHLAKEIRALRGMRGREIATSLAIRCGQFHPLWKPNSPCSFALKEQWAATDLPFPKLNILSNPPPPRAEGGPLSNATSLDLYWPNAKSMSNTTATATTPLPKESPRTHSAGTPLQLMGVTVITVTRGQLYNAASFDRTARTIATSIGVRLPKQANAGSAKTRCFVTSY